MLKKVRNWAQQNIFKKVWNEVHQSYLVVFLCIGIIIGAILALVLRINYFASPVWIGFVIMILVGAYLKPKVAFVAMALIAGMILMFFRASEELFGENYIRQFYGEMVMVTGVVNGDPESDEGSTKIKLTNLHFGPDKVAIRGNIYVNAKYMPDLARSDEVALSGKLSEGFGTYAGYMYRPIIKNIRRPDPGDMVLNVRNWFAERIRKLVSEPEASLGLSYLLGMKSGLPEDLSENLRMVGLVHIVVASGAHLSILVEVARKLFGKLSRFAGFLFSILFVVFFMSMVGWTPSILRAGVMAILTITAGYVGRKIAPWRMILMVVAFTLMLNPMFLINLGWLLSFASFAGIMILGPKLSKFFFGCKKPGFIASTIMTTLAATLMTLPIILYYYGAISLISVVANLLILPTLPWAMGLVFLTGVVASVPFLENAMGFLATKILDFHIVVVEFFGGMKQFMVNIEPYQAWVFLGYGLILVLFAIGLLKRKMVKLKKRLSY